MPTSIPDGANITEGRTTDAAWDGVSGASTITGYLRRIGTLLAGILSVSLGNSTGKTVTQKTGSLTTSTTTASQTVITYTVTTGKTFYLEYLSLDANFTAVSTVASNLGSVSLQIGGVAVITHTMSNPSSGEGDRVGPYAFSEPIPVPAGTVIRVACTPAAATSMQWVASFGGYEK